MYEKRCFLDVFPRTWQRVLELLVETFKLSKLRIAFKLCACSSIIAFMAAYFKSTEECKDGRMNTPTVPDSAVLAQQENSSVVAHTRDPGTQGRYRKSRKKFKANLGWRTWDQPELPSTQGEREPEQEDNSERNSGSSWGGGSHVGKFCGRGVEYGNSGVGRKQSSLREVAKNKEMSVFEILWAPRFQYPLCERAFLISSKHSSDWLTLKSSVLFLPPRPPPHPSQHHLHSPVASLTCLIGQLQTFPSYCVPNPVFLLMSSLNTFDHFLYHMVFRIDVLNTIKKKKTSDVLMRKASSLFINLW